MDGEKYKSMMGGWGVVGMGCGGGQKGAVDRLMSCNAPLRVSRLLWVNTLDGSMFHWAIVRGKKLYLY